MTESSPRFDPMQILDAEWRKRTWKGWLRSRWLGVEDVKPTPPELGNVPTLTPPPVPVSSVGCTAVTKASRDAETRRRELRARFDDLIDRLGSIEDNLDSLVKRFALSSVHQRRHEQRLLERVDSNADLIERQNLVLESMQASLQRVEQRVERLERRILDRKSLPVTSSSREGRELVLHDDYEDYSDLEEALSSDCATSPRTVSPAEPVESSDAAAPSGPTIHGNLAEMSLGTVLAMLELERRTGLLQVTSEDGTIVTATLRAGAIVGARRRETEADPVDVVREALRFRAGFFLFRQSGVEVVSGPPRSVGSVLLEATSRNDEAARAS